MHTVSGASSALPPKITRAVHANVYCYIVAHTLCGVHRSHTDYFYDDDFEVEESLTLDADRSLEESSEFLSPSSARAKPTDNSLDESGEGSSMSASFFETFDESLGGLEDFDHVENLDS